MYTDIKLTEISESSGKIERVFNGNIAQLIVAVANMMDSNVYEVVVKKK